MYRYDTKFLKFLVNFLVIRRKKSKENQFKRNLMYYDQ